MLALYQVSSTEGWVYLMLEGIDQNGVGMQPIRDNNPAVIILFMVFLLIVHYFAMNLVVGVILENFQQRVDKEFLMLTEKQRVFVKTQKNCSFVETYQAPQNPHLKNPAVLFQYCGMV